MCDFYTVVVLLAFKGLVLVSVFRKREMVDILRSCVPPSLVLASLVTVLIFVFFFVASRDCSFLFFIA